MASGASELVGRVAVAVAALTALTFKVPGPLPVSAMLHWLEAASDAPQFVG
jgi:hypothetical protein